MGGVTSDGTDAIAAALDRLVMWSRRAIPMPISATQVSTLERLRRDGPLRVSDLAAREQLSQPGMTILLNRLEQAHLAERLADPTDGRATLVRATAAGVDLVERRSAARRARIGTEVRRLSDPQQGALAAAIEALEALAAAPDRDNNPTESNEMTAR
jgi:DNA-binding MarR family transcriptional regulator